MSLEGTATLENNDKNKDSKDYEKDKNKDNNKDQMFLNLLNELGKIDNAEKKDKDKDKTCRHALHVCDVVRQQSINVFDVKLAYALQCRGY